MKIMGENKFKSQIVRTLFHRVNDNDNDDDDDDDDDDDSGILL